MTEAAWIVLLCWVHIFYACVLLGTDAGIAFFMVIQPVTGLLLAIQMGWPLTQGWIVLSVVLYVFVGSLWLPLVWIQHRLRDLARATAARGGELPEQYHRLYRTWFLAGIPAFAAVLVIVWLMVARPVW